jgi:hypothetical protein
MQLPISTSMVFNPTVDSAFVGFADDDRVWLKAVFTKFPDVGGAFKAFLQMDVAARLETASAVAQAVRKQAWAKRGIVNPEVVSAPRARYVRAMEHVLGLVVRDKGMLPEAMRDNIRELLQMVHYHDVSLALLGADIAQYRMARVEEQRLQLLVLQVIFSDTSSHALGRLLAEYTLQKSAASHIARDLAMLEPVYMSALYEAQQPDKTGLFVACMDAAAPQVASNIGKHALQHYLSAKADIMKMDDAVNASEQGI